jgi:hypothetical protein
MKKEIMKELEEIKDALSACLIGKYGKDVEEINIRCTKNGYSCVEVKSGDSYYTAVRFEDGDVFYYKTNKEDFEVYSKIAEFEKGKAV